MQTSYEQRFIEAVSQIAFLERDPGHSIAALQGWQAELDALMRTARLDGRGLSARHELAAELEGIHQHLQRSVDTWAEQWAGLQPARELAHAFDDKVMLLVFGKFNAGKSSFCNFLAERFLQLGKPVRYLRLESGELVDSETPFQEGSTETTAHLQVVMLGKNLLLLDTPGLHSMTQENAALTQRYMDSADGVLWLSSSTSPGQVQELDELGQELRRNKPLLPVLTRSDYIEEDEVDGELCKLLLNKTPERRQEQEADVYTRATDKLRQLGVDVAALRGPVSVSCHAARSAGLSAQAMRDAGFERLYASLLEMVGPALSYKQRQPAEMLLHHLEENVLGSLKQTVAPRLATLQATLDLEAAQLEEQRLVLAQALWRDTAPMLPELLQAHGGGALNTVCDIVSTALREAFSTHGESVLTRYVAGREPRAFSMELEAGHLAMAQGTHGADDDFTVRYELLESALRERIDVLVDVLLDQCSADVRVLAQSVSELRASLQAHALKLQGLALALRAQPAPSPERFHHSNA